MADLTTQLSQFLRTLPTRDVGSALPNDGGTDATAAIQRAIDACPAGGRVDLPTGRFKVTAPLVITRALTLQGTGAGSFNTDVFGGASWGGSPAEAGSVIESPLRFTTTPV